MSKFKQGDVVELVGQPGIRMTVNTLFGADNRQYGEQAVCLWFDTRNRLRSANFFVSLLQLAPIRIVPPTVGG